MVACPYVQGCQPESHTGRAPERPTGSPTPPANTWVRIRKRRYVQALIAATTSGSAIPEASRSRNCVPATCSSMKRNRLRNCSWLACSNYEEFLSIMYFQECDWPQNVDCLTSSTAPATTEIPTTSTTTVFGPYPRIRESYIGCVIVFCI